MDFHWNEEQLELREVARAFLADHSTGDAIRAVMGSELGFDPALWKQLGSELGWTAVAIPEEFGGLGLGFVELTGLLEVMGEALLCSPFFSSVCLGAGAILEAGSDDQKREWLPAIAEGKCIATLACSEASGHWDAASIETIFEEDSDGFVLSGTKRFVPDGHCADLLVVVARRAGSRDDDGIAFFCGIPAESAGISRRRLPTMDQSFRQAEIEFDSVRVSASARLSGNENGAKALERTLELAAVGLAAEQVGGAQRCLDLAVAYAGEREQFGRPIGVLPGHPAQVCRHDGKDRVGAFRGLLRRLRRRRVLWGTSRSRLDCEGRGLGGVFHSGRRGAPDFRRCRLHLGVRHPSLL